MKKIDLKFNHHNHSIIIDKGIINNIEKYLNKYLDNKVVIITQKNIFKIYKNIFIKYDFNMIFIEDDELAKSFEEYKKTIEKLIELKCNRKTILIALGGGVVGDLTGFVASTYMRGIRYIQMPTTLLSMIDSSIGGKTGINLTKGKNLVGSFYQPELVLVDYSLIQTLPKKEIISALGEIIKYAAISDLNFLNYFKKNIDNIIIKRDIKIIEEIIKKCITIKSYIVQKDEKDINYRQVLNFGHTLAHALEKEIGYGKISHGEAVAYGLITASYLSMQFQKLSFQEYELICNCIKKLSLPLIKNININKLIQAMKNDKKNNQNNINFVLLNKIGYPKINNVINESKIKEAIKNNEYISY